MTTVSSGKEMFHCYNKGCGKKFDLDNNPDDACQHHPGFPVFHDALKGWSCCNKKSTDFTQFLNIPGCTKTPHSNVKPEKPAEAAKEEKNTETVVYEAPKPQEPTPRPTIEEPLVELKRTIAPSLITALENLKKNTTVNTQDANTDTTIPLGTSCKNTSCKAEYKGQESELETCYYHPGYAVFHEGMKYWSCCQRKTSEFENFLNQEGCTSGSHVWFKQESEQVNCRYDFHQSTGNLAIVTIYSKNPLPEKTSIQVNSIKLDICVKFEGGSKTFAKTFDLFGVIKVEESKVDFFQSKVEIKLKKADPISWAKLEFVPKK